MLTLTFTTGVVDAVGYLGLDRVFAGNMTGNVVILGMALIGAEGLPVMGPLVALAGFFGGAALAGVVLRTAPPGWTVRVVVMFTVTAVIELVCAGAVFVAAVTGAAGVAVAGALGLAMGIQAAAARSIAEKDVTTVVVTSTLTGLAADLMRGRGARRGSWRRLWAITAIALGAFAGAAMLWLHAALGLLVAGVLTAAVALLGASGRTRGGA